MSYQQSDPNCHHTSEAIPAITFGATLSVFDLTGKLVGTIPAGSGTASADAVQTIGTYTPGYQGWVRIGTSAGVVARGVPVPGAMAGFTQSTAAATPNATLNTNGAAVTTGPDVGFSGLTVDDIDLVYASVGVETVTATITATFNDGTTSSAVTDTSTTTATHSLDITSLQNLRKSGLYVTLVSVVAQSSINSSTATVTARVRGEEVR